jgi:hypothetical protein
VLPLKKKLAIATAIAALSVPVLAAPGHAAPLPDNCTKVQGEVTCTTFEGPGRNQAGVGETTITETQGNTTNVSPEPQDLDSSESCNPATSQGRPCNP